MLARLLFGSYLHLVKYIRQYLFSANLALQYFVYTIQWLCIVSKQQQLSCIEFPYTTRLVLSTKPKPKELLLGYQSSSKSSTINKRKSIGKRGDPQGILVSIRNQLLLNLQKKSLVWRPWRKAIIKQRTYSRQPLVQRTQSNLLQEMYKKALPMSKLSIETIQPRWAFYIVLMLVVSRSIVVKVEHIFLVPIQF